MLKIKLKEEHKIFMAVYLMTLTGIFLGLILGVRLALPGYITTDTWWHLEWGRAIWEAKALPDTDIYSWTMPGAEVFPHEWLFEILLWLAYSKLGYVGVLAFGTLPVILIAMIVAKRLESQVNPLAAILIYAATLLPLMPMLTCRPHLYTLFFAHLWLYAYTSDKRLLWILPMAMVFWVNMHSGALLGVAISLGFFMASLIPGFTAGSITNTQTEHKKAFVLAFLPVTAASLANPMGTQVYSYAYKTFNEEVFMAHIQEWQVTLFNFLDIQLYYFLPLAVFLAGLLLNSRARVELYAVLLLFGTLVKGAVQFRWLGFLSFASLPALLGAWSSQGVSKTQHLFIGFLLGVLLAFCTGVPSDLEEVAELNGYPALEYIDDGDRLLNFYGCGGYLLFHGKKVFIDGRADFYAFKGEVFEDYVKFANELNADILDKYGVDAVLWPSGTAVDNYLKSTGWQEEHKNEKWVLYRRS